MRRPLGYAYTPKEGSAPAAYPDAKLTAVTGNLANMFRGETPFLVFKKFVNVDKFFRIKKLKEKGGTRIVLSFNRAPSEWERDKAVLAIR